MSNETKKVKIVGLQDSDYSGKCKFCGGKASLLVQPVGTPCDFDACNKCIGKGELGGIANVIHNK